MHSTKHADGRWYALRVRSRCEKLLQVYLIGIGYQSCLPTYRARRQWMDQVKNIELPLFPGYVFCKFDFSESLQLFRMPTGISNVTCGNPLVAVDDADVLAVQRIVHSGLIYGPGPFPTSSQRISIQDGPLTGLEGNLLESDGCSRILVSVKVLRRSVAAQVNEHCFVSV